MTDEERKALVWEKDKLERQIPPLEARLKAAGELLGRMADHLRTAAEVVTFTGAPEELRAMAGGYPPHFEFAWKDLPDWEKVAADVRDLRRAKADLRSVETQLGDAP